MHLMDLIHRTPVPVPWAEGDNIPWSDSAFSERMLVEHLTQEHDAASRRLVKIDAHVDWIHRQLLSGRLTRILDLGCGPGLYTSRLARLGHSCVGIDFSPASIAYVRETAVREALDCTYLHQDIRAAEYGSGFGLAMLIFGEFNVFCPGDARRILRRAHGALCDGGLLLLEPSTYEAVRREADRGPTWYTSPTGLFSDRPHLCLMERFWDVDHGTLIMRYYVIDASSGSVTRHASSSQAYTDQQYADVLRTCGFNHVVFHPSLTGQADASQPDFVAVVARKRAARA